mmetsp:Transcript_27859/g.89853  ORF Transcript_27859/g.89853 Transcript_27859/m.89853 type:complete len:375 (+) Transcript_27859:112-1236(+)
MSAHQDQNQKEEQRKGVVMMLVGVLITTPDAVLLRWAQACEMATVSILFFKLLIIAMVMLVYALAYEEGKRLRAIRRRPWLCVALGASTTCVSILLTYAFEYTQTAVAVMLFSLHPLWSGIFGWIFLGDVLPRKTVGALGLAILALILMFFPELRRGSFGAGTLGDAMALLTSLSLSAYLCFARYASKVEPELSVPTVSSLALIAASVALVAVSRSTVVFDGLTTNGIVATVLDGVVVGAVNVANACAPKYATATQVGLISLIEAVLSPFWVYLVYKEVPDLYTIIGGIFIIIILAGHELIATSSPGDDDDLDKQLPPVSSPLDKLVHRPSRLPSSSSDSDQGASTLEQGASSTLEQAASSTLDQPLLAARPPQ